jgi:nucleotide-binding universal stress UspA family protein
MSRDRELPKIFQRLNKWGVPSAGMLLATIVPMLLVIIVKDMSGLADLYAVGVVGAIATNLGATSTDRKLSIKSWERTLMFATFIVMAAIEMSLLIDKPNARYFAVTILAVGLILRGLVQERRMKKEAQAIPERVGVEVIRGVPPQPSRNACDRKSGGRVHLVRRSRHRAHSRFRLARSARDRSASLSALCARTTVHDRTGHQTEMAGGPRGEQNFGEAKAKAADQPPLFCYAVSPSAAETIVDVAATLGAARVIVGAPQRNALLNLIRGSVIREVSHLCPKRLTCSSMHEDQPLPRFRPFEENMSRGVIESMPERLF